MWYDDDGIVDSDAKITNHATLQYLGDESREREIFFIFIVSELVTEAVFPLVRYSRWSAETNKTTPRASSYGSTQTIV